MSAAAAALTPSPVTPTTSPQGTPESPPLTFSDTGIKLNQALASNHLSPSDLTLFPT